MAGSARASGVSLRSHLEIREIRQAAQAAWRVLERAIAAVICGAQTSEINIAARKAIADEGAASLFESYRQGDSPAFGAAACVCVNDQVVHGLPGARTIMAGDLVGVDVGLRLGGWCADVATSVIVEAARATSDADSHASVGRGLIADTRQVLEVGLGLVKPGRRWSEVARAMEQESQRLGRGIVTEYVGHGIGRGLHEPPKVPAYWTGFSGDDFELEAGMVLAIEPILLERVGRPEAARGGPVGRGEVRVSADGWTVATVDGGLACHEERMIAVTSRGAEVLAGGR